MKKFKTLYDEIKIGDKLEIVVGGRTYNGVLMDKYLSDDNLFADILLDPQNGQANIVLERRPFFSGDTQLIYIIDAV